MKILVQQPHVRHFMPKPGDLFTYHGAMENEAYVRLQPNKQLLECAEEGTLFAMEIESGEVTLFNEEEQKRLIPLRFSMVRNDGTVIFATV